MAGHQGHLGEFGHVPCADNDAARVRVAFQGLNDLGDLVNVAAIRRGPAAPLHAIDRPQVTVLARPLVPNRDAALAQPVVVAGPGEKPQQLLNDGAQVHLLGGDQRKALVQVKPHLVAKHALGARARAVPFGHALRVHMAHEIFVLRTDRTLAHDASEMGVRYRLSLLQTRTTRPGFKVLCGSRARLSVAIRARAVGSL